jgi:hypothetical protein
MERSEQYFSYTLAKTLGLFIKRCAAKGLITNQKSKEKTRYQRHKHATHGAPYALRCERVGQADDDDTNKEFVMRQTYVRSDGVVKKLSKEHGVPQRCGRTSSNNFCAT